MLVFAAWRWGGKLPNGSVERSNSEDVPFGVDPAPQRSISIHSSLNSSFGEKVNKSGNKWNSVAEYEVVDLEMSKLWSIELPVEGEVYVCSHCESPIHDSLGVSLLVLESSRGTDSDSG